MLTKAYWFSHDYNAKDDPKCMLLIDELGPEGYGIYWILIETLREQNEYKYPIKLLSSLARKYGTTLPKMEVVVKNYSLFAIENNEFFLSKSLCRRMKKYDEKCKQMSINAKMGAKKQKQKLLEQEKELKKLSLNDSSEQLHNKSIAIAQLEEKKKEEKKKEKNLSSLGFENLHRFKKYIINNFEGKRFKLKYPNPFDFADTTYLLIRDGYLHNTISGEDFTPKKAIDIWHHLFADQDYFIGALNE